MIVDLELFAGLIFFFKKFIHVYVLDANFSEDRNQELIVCLLSPLFFAGLSQSALDLWQLSA